MKKRELTKGIKMEEPNNKTLYIVEGVIIALIGAAAIAVPGVFTLSLEIVLGWLLIISGAVELFKAWQERHLNSYLWPFFVGLLNIVVGVLLLMNPMAGIITLTLLLIAYFILSGILLLAWSFQVKPRKMWWLLALNGLLAFAMAAILIAGWPQSAVWAIGLLFGINMLFTGISIISIASHLPSPPKGTDVR